MNTEKISWENLVLSRDLNGASSDARQKRQYRRRHNKEWRRIDSAWLGGGWHEGRGRNETIKYCT